jgi:hypothetical protein
MAGARSLFWLHSRLYPCRKFELPGADKALRGMWPLVFSKHEPVRQSVLDSWHILHLHDKQVKQQVCVQS